MFYYFFEDYKEKIYKGSRGRLNWFERIMFIWLIFSFLFFAFSLVLNFHILIKIIAIALLLIVLILIWIYHDRKIKNNRESLLNNYKSNHINELISLLKSSKYNLYNTKGIDWLIICCKNKEIKHQGLNLLNSIKKFFTIIIYPIMSLCLGLVLKDFSSKDITAFVLIVITLTMLAVGLYIEVKPIISFILFPERDIVEYLQDELEYIKTQLK